MIAARYGNTDNVVEVVKGGADIDMQNKVCCLFLHLTLCIRRHYPVSVRCIDYLALGFMIYVDPLWRVCVLGCYRI